MKRSQAFMLVGSLLVTAANGIAKAEEPRSMLDGDVVALESSYVELVVDASGDVIQVKVEDCEGCERTSYLPSRNLVVTKGGQRVDHRGLNSANRGAGTLVLGADSGLVREVAFWAPRGREEERGGQ